MVRIHLIESMLMLNIHCWHVLYLIIIIIIIINITCQTEHHKWVPTGPFGGRHDPIHYACIENMKII